MRATVWLSSTFVLRPNLQLESSSAVFLSCLNSFNMLASKSPRLYPLRPNLQSSLGKNLGQSPKVGAIHPRPRPSLVSSDLLPSTRLERMLPSHGAIVTTRAQRIMAIISRSLSLTHRLCKRQSLYNLGREVEALPQDGKISSTGPTQADSGAR